MAVVEVSIVPVGTNSLGLSNYVAGCLKVLKEEENIKYQLTSMGTIIEGDLDHVLQVVREMHDQPFEEGIGRVVTTVRIDDRRDKDATMNSKVSAVKEKI